MRARFEFECYGPLIQMRDVTAARLWVREGCKFKLHPFFSRPVRPLKKAGYGSIPPARLTYLWHAKACAQLHFRARTSWPTALESRSHGSHELAWAEWLRDRCGATMPFPANCGASRLLCERPQEPPTALGGFPNHLCAGPSGAGTREVRAASSRVLEAVATATVTKAEGANLRRPAKRDICKAPPGGDGTCFVNGFSV